MINKIIVPISPRIYLNKPIKNIIQYNNISAIDNGNGNMTERINYAKVRKLNLNKPINSIPNIININNQNILNNYNYETLNKNINRNYTLNQFYNLNLLNKNQPIYNNNILFINKNINKEFNINRMPRVNNISPFFPLRRIKMGLNGNNYQNYIYNPYQTRLTNIPTINRYGLDNNINIDNGRLTADYFNSGNYFKYQNNLSAINYQNSQSHNNFHNVFGRLNHNSFSNQFDLQKVTNNSREININQINASPVDHFTNIITNNYYSGNLNNLSNTNNNINRETILPSHNIKTNNSYLFNSPKNNTTTQEIDLDAILNNQHKNDSSLNNILNQFDNINQNTNIYMNTTQKDVNPQNFRFTEGQPDINLNQFFKNYTQPIQNQMFPQDNNYAQVTRINKGGITLKDFGALSRPGRDEMGMTKTNQDSFIAKKNINNIKDFNIFGVLDGHGPNGHFISQFASQSIPNQIINSPEIQMNTNIESIYNILKRNNYQIIRQAFISTDNQLRTTSLDIKESGTTCCLVIHIGAHIICANVGDSRAIAVYDEHNDPNLNFLKPISLSIDYKPELAEEKARITMAGGVVEQLKDSFGLGAGPFRVFAPGKEYPGLAMSRSIGDLVGKNYGIIADPGIIEYNITINTRFIIVCSDGVWEFLSNEEVSKSGRQFYLHSNASELCQELISRSIIEWQVQDSSIDDITAVVAFF
jgi:serine/threonine protein phosphatase PrpC